MYLTSVAFFLLFISKKDPGNVDYISFWGWSDGSVVKLVALPEDPGLIPSTHMVVPKCL